MKEARLLRIDELAAELGPSITTRTIRTWVATRKIPYLKPGRRTLLFDPIAVRVAIKKFNVEAIE